MSRHSSNRNSPVDLKALSVISPWDWPDETAGQLARCLWDREAPEAQRRLALELVVELCDGLEEPFMACLEILCNPSESDQLRAEAAIALGPTLEEMDGLLEEDEEASELDPEDTWISPALFLRAKATLRELWYATELPELVRRKVLEASVRASQPWHCEAIRTAYAMGDADWTLSAVFAMQYVGGFEVEILESLAHLDLDVRCEAIQAAGNWSLEEAWPQVRSILDKGTRNKRLLLAAIEAAPALSPEAQEYLQPYCESKDEDIADLAAEVLSMLEGEGLGEEQDVDEWEDQALEGEDDPEPLKGRGASFRN